LRPRCDGVSSDVGIFGKLIELEMWGEVSEYCISYFEVFLPNKSDHDRRPPQGPPNTLTPRRVHQWSRPTSSTASWPVPDPLLPLKTLLCQRHGITTIAWPCQTICTPNEPGATTEGAGSTVEAMPVEPVGTPQTDPRPPPALYTDVPMGDAEDILDWELDQSPDHL
jgi:hypothetical protein